MDDKILISFVGISDTKANQLATELRNALLNAAVSVDKHGQIEVEYMHDPNQAGSKGALIWHFAVHITTATILGHSLSDTALAVATAEAFIVVVNKTHEAIKIRCPQGGELEVTPTFSRDKIKEIADWLHKCMLSLANKRDDKSQP